MSNELSQEEWLELMQSRINNIIDNSNNLYDLFPLLEAKSKNVINTHKKTEHFANISNDELSHLTEDLTTMIYATPLVDDFFYIKKNEENEEGEMLFFACKEGIEQYKKENNDCLFLYLRFRDIITLKNFYNITTFTVYFSEDYYLAFSEANIDAFYEIYTYENANSSSNYIVGAPSESYKEATEQIKAELENYPEVEKAYLYHVFEAKDKTQEVFDNKYEEMYDVFVLEMPENNYITLRDYINNITNKTNGHGVKVVIHNSDLGMLLLKNEGTLIYSK